MTHTRNRKLRERSTVRVKKLYPALIEGRMARGHVSLDGPEPWTPKLHGWREIGCLTEPFNVDWRDPAPISDIERTVNEMLTHTGYVPTMEQRQFLSTMYQLPPGTPLFFAPYRRY